MKERQMQREHKIVFGLITYAIALAIMGVYLMARGDAFGPRCSFELMSMLGGC